jgi:hypothetical protein
MAIVANYRDWLTNQTVENNSKIDSGNLGVLKDNTKNS